MDLDGRADDAWVAIAGVGVGYAALLAVILVVLFLVPYLLFTAL